MPPYDSALIIHNRYNYYIYDSCTLNTKLGNFSETLKEKWASHIHPEEKETSHVWIKLKKELTSSDLHIYLCAIHMTPLSNTTIRNDDP